MPGLLKKISDYDRIALELEEIKNKLAEVEKKLEETRSDLERTSNQLKRAHAKAREERRRRAEEEARRGEVERQLSDKLREMDDLGQRLRELEESGSKSGGAAVLSRESELDPERVLAFVNEVGFDPLETCLTASVPPGECESYLARIPGMGSWSPRMARHNRGLVAFMSGRKACILEPPLPIESELSTIGDAFDFSVLDSLLEKQLVGFVSIHRDHYAVCLLDGKVRDSIFEEKDVLGKTKKGGFSQARYARSRDDQFKHLLSEAEGAATRIFSKADPSYILVEGDDRTISALSDMKGAFDRGRLIRFTMHGKMNRASLERVPRLIWRWKAWAFDLPGPIDQPSG